MKIIIIGSPGAGKSTLTRRLNNFLKYPVMHLDKVYHTTGKQHITRDELVDKVNAFTSSNEKWIIDGNYISTVEMRINLADIIIVFDLDPKICINNAYSRSEENIKTGINRDDMADGFDETITNEFVNFIRSFRKDTMPKIDSILKKYSNKKIIKIKKYEDIDEIINSLK